MKSLLTNNLLIILLAFSCLVAGILASVLWQDFEWVSRSGSLVVGLGIISLSRTFILKKDLLLEIKASDSDLNLNAPEYYQTKNQPIPDYVVQDQNSRFALGVVGPTLSFLGSLIWGFGDLLNKFFVGFGAGCA
ncbi:hypothetical protein [Methylophaga frappieri]|uniref:hypothetical protein n=1 Tax=Methylophaga frappieri (strain ATCC BAA-2434 / DSM 25690 / JAM7) TaxID=754477 RepID=UPI00059E1E81|nr:hypothetical protein [Methylophaga frappieri]